MRMLVQRVVNANVSVKDKVCGKIDKGLLVFLGIHKNDSDKELDWLCSKLLGLRIFSDNQNKMNLSVLDIKGSILLISQFTLYANCAKGKRPSFVDSANPEKAILLYNECISRLKDKINVESGVFGAEMKVELTNDGPVTIMLEK